MSRAIKDDIVIEQVTKRNLSMRGLNFPQYSGNVSVNLEKVKLESSTGGLQPINILDSLQRNYDYVKLPNQGVGSIVLADGKELVTDIRVIHMLKALLLEQASTNLEYSRVVAEYFTHLLRITITKQSSIFRPSNESKVSEILRKKLIEFSKDKLPDIYVELVDRETVVEADNT